MNLNKVYKINLILFVTLIVGFLIMLFVPSEVLAVECTENGAYGQTCIYNKTFELKKKVRIEGDDSFEDKVVDVKEDEVIEFRIKIKNIGEVEVDDMKMTDFLPDELYRVGGSGLTEYFDNFEVGETKTFTIKARIDASEFDRDTDFEKCVVNKAKVEYDGTLEGSDTATVCYGNETIKELPDTGATSTVILTVMGMASIVSGFAIRKRK